MRGRIAILAVVLACSVSSGLYADVVHRRGSAPPVAGEVLASRIDDNGLYVRNGSGVMHFVPWDRIREVEVFSGSDSAERRRRIQMYMSNAEDLWRARSRVLRNDFALAEPLFERLYEQYRGKTHQTAMLVAEGLLRCRLGLGKNTASVTPALEVARMIRAGVSTDGFSTLSPIIDEETHLCPQLAAAWINSRALVRLERELAAYNAQEDEVVEAIARLYLRAVRQQLGTGLRGPGEGSGSTAGNRHPGRVLLSLIVECGGGDAATRAGARRRLEREIETLPAWAEPWARFAIGNSLISEQEFERRQQGMVQLIHVPAKFSRSHPYLAGLALAWVAEVQRADGDEEAAALLESELLRRFPNHPLLVSADPVKLPRIKDS